MLECLQSLDKERGYSVIFKNPLPAEGIISTIPFISHGYNLLNTIFPLLNHFQLHCNPFHELSVQQNKYSYQYVFTLLGTLSPTAEANTGYFFTIDSAVGLAVGLSFKINSLLSKNVDFISGRS